VEFKEKIDLLQKFDSYIERWVKGDYGEDGKECLRKEINELAPQAKIIVRETGCRKLISATPPPAIGGPALQNIDPFDMLFQNYYGMSFLFSLRDIIQQSIGVLKTGKLPTSTTNASLDIKEPDVPEK